MNRYSHQAKSIKIRAHWRVNMVEEERFYAGAKDIISIRITCGKCHGSSSIPLRGDNHIQSACAYCNEDLLPYGSSDYKAVHLLLQSLNTLKQREENAGCEIHFELPGSLNMPDDT